jgi:hypothetical protein
MAVAIHQLSPVAHLPLVLGVVRKLNVAALIDTFCPPHPAHGTSVAPRFGSGGSAGRLGGGAAPAISGKRYRRVTQAWESRS